MTVTKEELDAMPPLQQAKAIISEAYKEMMALKGTGASEEELRKKATSMAVVGAYAIANLDPLDAERLFIWMEELNLEIHKKKLEVMVLAADRKNKEVKE